MWSRVGSTNYPKGCLARVLWDRYEKLKWDVVGKIQDIIEKDGTEIELNGMRLFYDKLYDERVCGKVKVKFWGVAVKHGCCDAIYLWSVMKVDSLIRILDKIEYSRNILKGG